MKERDYVGTARALSSTKGHFFLTKDEAKRFGQLAPDEAVKYLEATVTFRIFPLWYLVVTLCSFLQQGEHEFTAHDAWWFGLIDEVPGSKLPSLRQWHEAKLAATQP